METKFPPKLFVNQNTLLKFAARFAQRLSSSSIARGNISPPRNNYKTNSFMYAIVEILGQQFKVEAGKKLYIHRMNEAEEGSKIEFNKVLLIDNDGKITVGAPTVAGAKVTAEVVSHVQGDTVLVFHKKRRKGYRKLNGHRQKFTQVKINEIVA